MGTKNLIYSVEFMENNQETGRKNEPGARGVNTTSRACKSPTEEKKNKTNKRKDEFSDFRILLVIFFSVLLIVKLQKKFFPVPLRPTYLGQ